MQKVKIHWPSALLSIILALTVWYTVTGRERVETWINVRLEVKGVPDGFVLLNGNNLPGTLEVRLRGPSGLIRNLTGQDIPLVLSLAHVKKGDNILHLLGEDIPISGAFDVMEIRPPVVEIVVDSVIEKEVQVTAVSSSTLPPGITKISYTPKPDKITIKGPESVIGKINKINALVILPTEIEKSELILAPYIGLPPGVEASPTNVTVTAAIEGKPKEITLARAITIESKNKVPASLVTTPASVQVKLEIPFDWDARNIKPTDLTVRINLPDDIKKADGQTFNVTVTAPEQTKIIEVKPAKVKVTVD